MNENHTLPKFVKGGIAKPLYIGGSNQKEVILSEDELLKVIGKMKENFTVPFVELKAEVILKGYEKDEEGYCWPIYEVKK